ncbi:MAG: hypothetical protein E2O29_01955 [Deltaproteobacteria bacterium]|nr:MAG: hypothetical protein E2O29_01955 [Deltaproteobacteria bacterium]
MNTEEKVNSKKLVDSLVKEKVATKAYQKLNNPPLEVSVYRHTSSVETLQDNAIRIDEQLSEVKDEKQIKILNEKKQFAEEQLAEFEKDKIEGILLPMTWRDLNDVKAAITEAIVHFSRYKFDPDVQLIRIAAEERYMTVFCALKQKNDKTIRYFKSLEEIAQIDELTIFDLYNRWEKYFVLTDEEVKN